MGYINLETNGAPIKAWVNGVQVEQQAHEQLKNISSLPIIYSHIAVMPDVHMGKGATVGSVIATNKAIIPAAVGVDIGCGMMACKTTLVASDLPEDLSTIRSLIERAVPHGRDGWQNVPASVDTAWSKLDPEFKEICEKYPKLQKSNNRVHLGTLGTGNHFIELCLDENNSVWIMLHSGSRGVGNLIGQTFIELAKKDVQRHNCHIPDEDLAYLDEGSKYFGDYVKGVNWAQKFARMNREVMMTHVIDVIKSVITKPFQTHLEAVNCHHNYVQLERHFGEDVYLTRKGAVSAKQGELGIIPGSMGTRSYIVRGKGNPDSFQSCSHGAGRNYSRTQAKKLFTLEQHIEATKGVECRKDESVIDETPLAYKDIDAVMAAQSDLVDIVYTLKQILCVKG